MKGLYGFQRYALKFQFRHTQTCFNEGITLGKAIFDLMAKWFVNFDKDQGYNLNDLLLQFNTKCNFLDTI